MRKQIKDLQTRAAVHEGDALAAASEETAVGRFVVAALPGWDAGGLKSIASRIAESPGHIAVLVGAPSPASLVVARAAGVPLDASAVLRALLERHGGKGGGRPELAQGGGVTSPAAEVLHTARELVGTSTGAP